MNKDYTTELKNGYLNENGVAKIKFIDGYPQELADEFNKATPNLSTKQSRSFFDAVNKLNNRLARKDINFDELKIELSMLKSMINDKVNKGSIPKIFFDFFSENIEAIKSIEDFKVFKLHLEAICNYLKDDKPKASNGGGNGGFRGNGSGNYNGRPNNGQNNRNSYNNNFNRK